MNEELTYRSHTIDLELMEIRPQRFRWLYVIDRTSLYRGHDVLQPMHLARAEALAKAFGQIQALEAIATLRTLMPAVAPAAMHPTPRRAAKEDGGPVTTANSEAARRLAARRSLQAERAGAQVGRDTSHPETSPA